MAYTKLQNLYNTAVKSTLRSVAQLPVNSYLNFLSKSKNQTPISKANTKFQQAGARLSTNTYLAFMSK